jgi:predicted RNA polymerase sigma factor
VTTSGSPDIQRAIDAVWRIESPRLIAGLVRMVRDVGLAEDFAHDALVAALEQWPAEGVPRNPGAWLMQVAKHRALDHFRRHKRVEQKHVELGAELDARRDEPEPELVAALAKERAGFEIPRGVERAARLTSVLEVIYLIFNEGYTATAGGDWMRPGLCEDALRLARVLQGLMPDEPEVHGLAALLEFQFSRSQARVDATGEPILLLNQNRAHWDRILIARGRAALARAEQLGGNACPYTLQAAIAGTHAAAATAGETDWPHIAALYAILATVSPSPVVELNRAVAVSMAFGPQAGLGIVDTLVADGTLEGYHLLPSVRGDFLMKLDRAEEARVEFERAAALTRNDRERALLLQRARDAATSGPSGAGAAG